MLFPRRRLMRMERNKSKRTAFAAIVTIAMGIVSLSGIERQELDNATGSPQLVSIRQLSDFGDMCVLEPVTGDSNLNVPREDSNLFAAFQETSALAASQNGGETGDVTRPPIRTIRDTYPIY